MKKQQPNSAWDRMVKNHPCPYGKHSYCIGRKCKHCEDEVGCTLHDWLKEDNDD